MGQCQRARPSVLILVLVDVGLGHSALISADALTTVVLILVLVDVGLGHCGEVRFTRIRGGCLNPCFSGCWSRTCKSGYSWSAAGKVLILVLVDVGLGRRRDN